MRLAATLKQLRDARGFSQTDVATKARVTTAYVSLLEAGKKQNPSLNVLRRLAKALNVPVVSLMEAGGVHGMDTLLEAHLPTWFRIQLREASQGTRSYLEVGWHLGYYHPDTFDLDDGRVEALRDEDCTHPTRTLRRLFASEEHPTADLVTYIPARRRADFLTGLRYGIANAEFADVLEQQRRPR